MIQLPHVLSELAQMALDDMTTKLEPLGLTVDLRSWAKEDSGLGHCTVCAGGAVMVARLGLDPLKGESFGHGWLIREFGWENALALVAIDCLRSGQVGAAVAVLEQKSFDPWEDAPRVRRDGDGDHDEYDEHPLSRPMDEEYGPEFLADLRELIADLRAAGR